jgi:hypothetical protein
MSQLPVLAFWVDEKTAIRERIGPSLERQNRFHP